jgi:hypothetical protein
LRHDAVSAGIVTMKGRDRRSTPADRRSKRMPLAPTRAAIAED